MMKITISGHPSREQLKGEKPGIPVTGINFYQEMTTDPSSPYRKTGERMQSDGE